MFIISVQDSILQQVNLTIKYTMLIGGIVYLDQSNVGQQLLDHRAKPGR